MRVLKLVTLLQLLCFSTCGFGQQLIKGKILNSQTKEPLAFANIIGPNKTGALADIDGKFELKVPQLPCQLTISLLGYQSQTLNITNSGEAITVMLKANPNQLNEVVITPTENPAWRIIRLASANRAKNNPEKNLTFSYNSYNKLFLTAKAPKGKDTTLIEVKTTTDSTQNTFFKKSYLFFSETYAHRLFLGKNLDKETILATKVSGFKNPAFGMLATQMQSFSFYNDLISINNKNYLSPITQNSENSYRFELIDTSYSGSDTVYIITYEPRSGKNFDALQGKLFVNTNGYAVQNVVAEPVVKTNGQLNAKIQQQYKQLGGVWFPEQLNTFLSMVTSSAGNKTNIIGEMRTYIEDVQLNPANEKKEARGIAADMAHDAGKKDSIYWDEKRIAPLTSKELTTYHLLDSLSSKVNLEKKLNLIQYLIDGQIPIGPVGVLLKDLFKYNNVEGSRLGLGIRTNNRISTFVEVGGAVAYGFKDKRYKYRADGSIYFDRDHRTSLNFLYKNDLIEPGVSDFPYSKLGITSSEQFRNLFINRMDEQELKQLSIKTRIGNSLTLEPFINQQIRLISGYDYQQVIRANEQVNLLLNSFEVAQVGCNLRLAVGEKFARIFNRVIPNGIIRYPLVQARISYSANQRFTNQNFTKVDLQIDHQLRLKLAGELSYRIATSYVDPVAPYPFLINPKGNFSNNALTVNAFGCFETMRFNEFLANRSIATLVYYDLKSLLFKTKKFSPGLVLTGNALFGTLSKPESHQAVDFKIPNKGFYEGGLLFTNLLKINQFTSIGAGFFYRLGHYASPSFKENYQLKLNFSYVID